MKGGVVMFKRNGFTLIELVMIIIILGILAAVAIPKYYNFQADARSAAEQGVVGGVRAGISTYYAQNKAWPNSLDNASSGACSSTNACFDTVLAQGGVTSSDWTTDGSGSYTGPNIGVYLYNSSDGSFLKQ
jgi:MSHA pilin protein MshA